MWAAILRLRRLILGCYFRFWFRSVWQRKSKRIPFRFETPAIPGIPDRKLPKSYMGAGTKSFRYPEFRTFRNYSDTTYTAHKQGCAILSALSNHLNTILFIILRRMQSIINFTMNF